MAFSDTHGVINLIKPIGVGSTELVAFVKRLLRVNKVGHGGTLDPFATGVLPIGINRGTKLLQALLEGDKSYTGTAVLGMETDSLDIEGNAVRWQNFSPGLDLSRIEEVLHSLMGTRMQQTPLFSARRVDGKRLYHVARGKKEILSLELPTRLITIHDMKVHFRPDGQSFDLSVRCSKGTYIRQLVQEIVQSMGLVAYLDKLCRTEVASLSLQNAISLEGLFDVVQNGLALEGKWFHKVPS
ncbi:MAG: tRNA pseudouridine(55) synthase TruB [Candidatus Cloacimonetes bacterium]|nr:tRNA pseudouridine(55) synthase TruB [Candidatus Cloacimonadota bacterium]